ncbi:hypothetical protein EVAR_4137_1 [Eumeta japonica]|uniref:Uncharacterized protein n=1 Tax=Eumeta variegata TaxID=151549 RepID=A0A4C1TIF8_EUMVA|nr:hypothetical protein EVAR_4137_1 [Eumeta japonica]
MRVPGLIFTRSVGSNASGGPIYPNTFCQSVCPSVIVTALTFMTLAAPSAATPVWNRMRSFIFILNYLIVNPNPAPTLDFGLGADFDRDHALDFNSGSVLGFDWSGLGLVFNFAVGPGSSTCFRFRNRSRSRFRSPVMPMVKPILSLDFNRCPDKEKILVYIRICIQANMRLLRWAF